MVEERQLWEQNTEWKRICNFLKFFQSTMIDVLNHQLKCKTTKHVTIATFLVKKQSSKERVMTKICFSRLIEFTKSNLHFSVKFRGHLQHFSGACTVLCCIANVRKKLPVDQRSFKIIYAACKIKLCCCNTAAESIRFDFAAVFKQQNFPQQNSIW